MADTSSQKAISAIAAAVATGAQSDVQAFLSGLVPEPSKFLSTQPSGMSAQWVGDGAAQLFSPAFGAVKADETGITFLGRKVVDFPFPKIVDKAVEKIPFLGKASAELREIAKAKQETAEATEKADALKRTLSSLEFEARELDRIQAKPSNGKSGNASNAAAFRNTQQQIESLERSVKLLSEAIGI